MILERTWLRVGADVVCRSEETSRTGEKKNRRETRTVDGIKERTTDGASIPDDSK